ncbi:annexin-B12-like [Hyalella azteca]|uniref:Annexin n=1 Tax=Hyalella azteca TaxID=294128 RepID=A0A8B7P149_HYAAZ|nr:annexin-B12-like [Hyalella azteca]
MRKLLLVVICIATVKAVQENFLLHAQPTLRRMVNFDPSMDASMLRKAMKGLGTDEASIINILANRPNDQRQKISSAFKHAYGKDLVKELKSELSGKFERVVLAMMLPTTELLADHLHEAMKGVGTNEDTLVEILCTRNNSEIIELKSVYERKHGKPLQKSIESETSGHFSRLLVSMTTGARDEANTNLQLAPQLAQQLYTAGEGKVGTDEAEFNRILSYYSYPLLRAVFDEYKKIKGKSLIDAIKSEFSGDIQNGLIAVVSSIENRPQFFAKCLHDAMKGKDDALIRLIVTRAEIDLGTIKQEYQKLYGKSLESHIKSDTPDGDYKKMLIALVDG